MDYEEFTALVLDKPSNCEPKTAEELRRHSVDAHIDRRPIERALHILTVGEEVQKLSVIQSLPFLLETHGSQTVQRVVNRVTQVLPTSSVENHFAASSVFQEILEKSLVNVRTYHRSFLKPMLLYLENRDQEVMAAWLEAILNVTDLLPPRIVSDEIFTTAKKKSDFIKPVLSRIIGCRLMGKAASRMNKTEVLQEVVPLVQSLVQDPEPKVRANMCLELNNVAKALGEDASKTYLWPCLEHLSLDSDAGVKTACLMSVTQAISHMDVETLRKTVLPLFRRMCAEEEREVIVAVVDHMGEICLGLSEHIAQEDRVSFIRHYQTLALHTRDQTNDHVTSTEDLQVVCRLYCARNLPAMFRFAMCSDEELHEELSEMLTSLSHDSYYMIRRTVAEGIANIAATLGPANFMIKTEFLRLLRDDIEDVLECLVPNIMMTLDHLNESGVIGNSNVTLAVIDLIRHLLKCEGIISQTHNWRLHADFFKQMEGLHRVIPPDLINSQFVSIAFTRIHNARPQPTRHAATRTLLIFLRYNKKQIQRNGIRARITAELFQSTCCYSRMLFLHLCQEALEIFSSKYFKNVFFQQVLTMAHDKVVNVRIKAAGLLLRLRRILNLPSDQRLLFNLKNVIEELLNQETDTDVFKLLKKAMDVIEGWDKDEDLEEHSRRELEVSEDRHKEAEEQQLLANPQSQLNSNSLVTSRRVYQRRKDSYNPVRNHPGTSGTPWPTSNPRRPTSPPRVIRKTM